MALRIALLSLSLYLPVALAGTPPASTAAPPAAAKPAKAAPVKKPRVVTVLAGFDLLDKDALKKQSMAAGASRDLGSAPVALAPRLGKVYGLTPEFCWNGATGAGQYVFTLWDDAQNAVYRGDVKGYRFRYPAGATALVPGKTYFWTVETPPSMSGSQQSEPVGFVVVSGEQRAAVEQKLAAAGSGEGYDAELARARAYTDARLWYDAVGAYLALMHKYPAKAELYDARGTLFAQLPVTRKDADQDFEHAEQLRAGTTP